MAFISGNNMGGKDVDYYDNPNYDPKNDGKSKIDKALKNAAESAAWAEESNRQYYESTMDYDFVVEAENEAAVDSGKLKQQQDATVSYFRARERERLNPGGAGKKIINEKFSKPSGTIDDKLAKFGFSYDPEDPDNYYANEPQAKLSDNAFNTNRTIARNANIPGVEPGNYTLYETTVQYEKGKPLPNTVAGVNQDLQARKARTRDFAMEFKGTVYDFIDDVKDSMLDDIDAELAEYYNKSDEYLYTAVRQPLSYNELENKYFPDDASKKAAKNELRKMIAFTDEASDITRNYSSLSQYAETIARQNVSNRIAPYGIGDDTPGVNDKLTKKNFEKGIKEFQSWKSKKGVPKIVRLINKLG